MWPKEHSKNLLKSRQVPTAAPDTPPVTVPSDAPLPTTSSSIGPVRPHQSPDSQTPVVAITAASLALIVTFIFAFYAIRHCREIKSSIDYKPNRFFKSLWPKRNIDSKRYRVANHNEQREPTNRENRPEATSSGSLEMAGNPDGADRTASLRSVITLPSYIPTARQNEQVLGREGERAGIDVVVEFPDTAEEEERRREEEMEALYQVRLARRRENEAREERRRMRRAARERGESLTPREIEEARRNLDSDLPGQTIEELRAEHDRLKRNRQHVVSTVSYAQIGVARHDGTRLNRGNMETERIGLLGNAANISSTHPNSTGRTGSILSNSSSMNSDFHHSMFPLNYSMENSCGFPSDLPSPGPLLESEQNNSPNPLFRTNIWECPRENSTRSNANVRGSVSLSTDSMSIVEEDPVPSSVPPEYGAISRESPMQSEELPPDYSYFHEENSGQNLRGEELNQSASESNENPSIPRNSASRSNENGSNISGSHPRRSSLGSRLHINRSSRIRFQSFANMRIRPLPSIQINPASPTNDRTTET